MKLTAFTLEPVLVVKPWGGRRLGRYGKVLPEGLAIGESWEVADLPDEVATDAVKPQSLISSGPLAGRTLQSAIEIAGEDVLGPVQPTADGRFPLLVKLIDARENLSVQVHPHEGYVADHPGARLKTESWYVVDVESDGVLYHDFVDGADLAEAKDAVGTPAIVPLMRAVPAEEGSFHHVPAGIIHSLGAGVMVAEVQTPSDTTYRLYDWAEEYGRAPRQMHYEEGAASLLMHPAGAVSLPPAKATGIRELTANEYYWMREHRHCEGVFALAGRPGPAVLMVMAGSIVVDDLELDIGATAIVPASATDTEVTVTSTATFLEIGLAV